jgi:transcriptional regulator with XRE-family HTH domain
MLTFSARLNRLFDTVYPPGRGPYSGAEAISALAEAGVKMSAPYLSQLRSGNRTNPSATTMAALAKFFGVKPAYFTDDYYHRELDRELTWLEITRDEHIRRIAERAWALSPQGRRELELKAEELLAGEGGAGT